ncbi:hypothetical protein [Anaerorhabdus sp.]|uniref:hypothetical protein n=1 Tax=Anaerorhabdus sp. TaxID=1872524 RepID=UPI002FCB0E8C
MEKYKEKLIKRRNMLIVVAVLAASITLFIRIYASDMVNIPSWLALEIEFLTGVFFAFELLVAIYSIKIMRVLNSPVKLQKLYAEENDERMHYIRAKAGQPLLMILSGILIIVALIIGAIDMNITCALIVVALFQMTVSVIYKLYLLKKI